MSISKHLTISLIQLLEQSERLHSFRKRPSIFFHEKNVNTRESGQIHLEMADFLKIILSKCPTERRK